MHKNSGRTLVTLMIFLGLEMIQGSQTPLVEVLGQPTVPYTLGNWTYVSKPVCPVKINASQILIGENWTYVYNLQAGSFYHAYFYGNWTDNRPFTNKTDYDIFVYSPLGVLDSLHTESAGLPEHLGTTVDEPYFVPKYSGNYSFLVKNDLKESRDQKEGTFMLIEHVSCNRWYERFLEGKVNDQPVETTSWAYEFTTSGQRIEIYVEVPDTLDMYEAQLYLMATPMQGVGALLNGVPVAWEAGLYGEANQTASGFYGGYNLTMEGVRTTNASASCEYFGEDMFINYTSPTPGNMSLYHLALIGENGNGTVRFMIKTDSKAPSLALQSPPERACTSDEVKITARISDESILERTQLSYTTDDWASSNSIDLVQVQNDTYAANIPGQPAGSTVKYRVRASDTAGNTAEATSRYIVKDATNMTFSLSKSLLRGGETIQMIGSISCRSATVTFEYKGPDTRIQRSVRSDESGILIDEFTPKKTGAWTVSASWPGDDKHFEVPTITQRFTVEKTVTSITCNVDKSEITVGADIIIAGTVLPQLGSMKVSFKLTKPDGSTLERYTYTFPDGTFDLTYKPDLPGVWRIQTSLVGDELYASSSSGQNSLVVNDTWMNQYKWHIVGSAGVSAAVAVGAFLSRHKKEEEEEE